jgi:hypothetical protein
MFKIIFLFIISWYDNDNNNQNSLLQILSIILRSVVLECLNILSLSLCVLELLFLNNNNKFTFLDEWAENIWL